MVRLDLVRHGVVCRGKAGQGKVWILGTFP